MEKKIVNQKEYLKKYLSGGDADKKKKKKKPKVGLRTVKIIDDDIDLKNMRPIDDNEFDIFITSEDAPQIAGIVDERGPVDFQDKRKWRIVTDNTDGDLTITSNEQPKKQSKPEKNLQNGADDDLSPPRPSKKQKETHGMKKNAKDSDSDLSPPRISKKKHKKSESSDESDDSSDSNARRHKKKKRKKEKSRKQESDSDLSPPRKSKHYDSDLSPPRKPREDDSDLSPPRKGRGNESTHASRRETNLNRSRKQKNASDSDLSPPRRSKKHYGSDSSPPRRVKKYNSHHSPPRKNKKNHDSNYTPPRRNKEPANYRRHKSSEKSKTQKDSDSDLSPLRKRSRGTDRNASPPRTSKEYHKVPNDRRERSKERDRYEERKDKSSRHGDDNRRRDSKREDVAERSEKKMKKTLDGKTAGLQDAKALREETEAHKKREAEHFRKLSKEISGVGKAAIVRDSKTGRKRDLEAEAAEEREKQKRQNELNEKYAKWGKGLKQVEDREEKLKDDLYEMSKPLARYADDADLDARLREQERDGDPMLEYIKQKQIKEGKRKPDRPTYEGAYLPNRFGIKPGHRWDGVDRSNGYEKKWFDARNAKLAMQEDAYKWSTADM